MNERFSAFLDNETSRDETDSVISALLNDEGLRASWGRQHWVRTTLRAPRDEPAVAVDPDFSKRVMQAIADEAPVAETAVPRSSATVAKTAGHRRRWPGVAGLAAVASAAGVVLLISQPLQRNSRPEEALNANAVRSGQPASTRTAKAAGAYGHKVAANLQEGQSTRNRPDALADHGRRASVRHWSVSDPAVQNELNGYLAQHNGMARSYGLSGTTAALVRVATYGQEPAQ